MRGVGAGGGEREALLVALQLGHGRRQPPTAAVAELPRCCKNNNLVTAASPQASRLKFFKGKILCYSLGFSQAGDPLSLGWAYIPVKLLLAE
jgi:hypothetical protein